MDQDYDGFGDSEVYLDGGIGGLGPVNTLLPRFDRVDTDDDTDRQS